MINKYIKKLFVSIFLFTCVMLICLSFFSEAESINTSIEVSRFKSPTTLISIEDNNIAFEVNKNSSSEQNLTVYVESNVSYSFGLSSSDFRKGSSVVGPNNIYSKILNKGTQSYSPLSYNFKSFDNNYNQSINKKTKYNLLLFLKSSISGNYLGRLTLHVKSF